MTAPTRQLSPNSGPIKLNPALPGWPAPAVLAGPPPRFHDVTDPDAYVDALADAVAAEAPPPAVDLHDPDLTRGQAQVLRAEQSRLIRILDRRVDDGRGDPRAVAAVLILLEDLAGQAPAVDDELAREQERRSAAAAARPRLAGVLSKRGDA